MEWFARRGITGAIFKAIAGRVKDENLLECVGNAEQVDGRNHDGYDRKLTNNGKYLFFLYILGFPKERRTIGARILQTLYRLKILGR